MSDLNTDYKAFVAKLFNRTGDLSKDFSHAVFGIITEIDELLKAPDATNAREEKGDLQFFLEALSLTASEAAPGIAVDRGEITQYPEVLQGVMQKSSATLALNDLLVELMDATKRWVGYGKIPADFALLVYKAHIAGGLATSLSPFQNDTLEDIRKTNMAKLLVRYPGGEFDAYRAVERDLEAERVALEKT